MVIKNNLELGISPARKVALQIAVAGLLAIDTKRAIENNVRLEGDILFIKNNKIILKDINKIFVAGVGKCSVEAAEALENVLGDKLDSGIVISAHKAKNLKKIKVFLGSHPLPSEKNIDATAKLIEFIFGKKENDLVIFIVSGGGSALLCQPKNLTCQDEKIIFDCLTGAGVDIRRLNIVRKHTSLARGGNLAKYAYPAQVISLIFSDVLNDDLASVSSGPTILDNSTVEDAKAILEEFGVEKSCGNISKGLIETPKDKKYFKKVKNILLVSNKVALGAMKEAAKNLGLSAHILDASLSGEAIRAGQKIAGDLHQVDSNNVLLYGGETTVIVKGGGRGGRNMELALSAIGLLKDDELILTLASDGRDNSDFAGAICDKLTEEKAKKLKLKAGEFLESNNSYDFFEKTKDALITGDTGANVSDLTIAIKK